MSNTLTNVEYGLLILAIYLLYKLIAGQSRPPLPPGPKGLPIVGNLFDIPKQFEWEVYAGWTAKWGDVISVSVFGTTIVVINSYERAVEMLDKKNAIYSDRPYIPMATEVMEMNTSMGLCHYNQTLKTGRRLIHQELGSSHKIRDLFLQKDDLIQNFISRLLRNPENLQEHCFHHAGSIILRIMYGYKTEERNDPIVRLANTVMQNASHAARPGAFLVNQLPILLKIPDWFPGTGWKRIGKEWAKIYWQSVDTPFALVEKGMLDGTAESSFVKAWLKKGLSAEDRLDLKYASAAMFAAGSDTSAVTLYAFFLLMAKHPEYQKKAQIEIDSICGTDRLPTFEDQDSLPYVRGIYLEVLRFHNVVPLGLPHCTMEDDIHNGSFIPKGTIIFPNIWKMVHNPDVYKNPFDFNPERFVGDHAEPDPSDIIFGFGRRICAGRLLAETSLYITIATVLAVFDVTPVPGEALELRVKPGIISHIEPFKCHIVPRMSRERLETFMNGVA